MFLKKNGESEKSEAYLPQSPPRKKKEKKEERKYSTIAQPQPLSGIFPVPHYRA